MAAAADAQWAQLLLAARVEKSDPHKALRLYLSLARADNCHAQHRLARAYYNGDLTPQNLTQAYFWMLLAKAGGGSRTSESHLLYNPDQLIRPNSCLYLFLFESALERSLPRDHLRLAQTAASGWRPGQQEASLPAPTAITAPTSPEPPKGEGPRATDARRSPAAPTVAAAPAPIAPRWAPLPQSLRLPPLSTSLDSVRLFEVASRSAWLVLAARSPQELTPAGDVALGSAIAVTSTLLLTNCHVIEGRPVVWIKQGPQVERAAVAFGDFQSDRCVLSVEADTLVPIRGIRGYDDLKVGEEVYTIGSPRGLEATLGQGIISGLRTLDQRRLLQTSAPISPGSSGGGLFDKSGNLIGITSFRLREGQNLNFAIAVEDYFQ